VFHLPGDIVVDRPGFKFFFPITTMLIVSAALSIIVTCPAFAVPAET
jgi:hypothetical protein